MVRNIFEMKKVVAIALVLTLMVPVMALAGDGKKYYKAGLKFEENRQWDKAAEQFALASAEKPSNVEYQLHLQRALVNAAVLLVERADMLADKKDYSAAYNIYRQAFSYDRGNEMALIKMRRMLEAQGLPTDGLPSGGDPAGPKYKLEDPNSKVSFIKKAAAAGTPAQLPGTRRFQKTQVIYRGDNLLSVIENLAQSMNLNVIFDTQVANQLRSSRINIELRDVTYPRALEMILRTNNLMYSQIDTRTIVIALDNPASRQRYEPNHVRTFYIKNADITEVRNAITQAIQSKSIVPVKQLNALIVRDSPANLELIESLIDSLDKSKAEVLIDINIYEVSNSDIQQIGNQLAAPATGSNAPAAITSGFLGGLGSNAAVDKSARAHTFINNVALGFALGLPTSAISFFQDRSKARLLASTQVHAFDREANAIRIGQRVPIQTASVFPGFSVNTGNNGGNGNNGNGNNGGINSGFNNIGLGGGFPQIQYENVGLNIDVTPEVYEDEVQMKMKLETSSVENPDSLTPIFNQRTMQSTARIKDGQTSLIAGVSQSTESNNRRGVAFLGMLPILGRLFSTPSTTNRQSDVVITVTPHILRRADIRESDHLARDVGTAQDPNAKLTLEQVIYLADLEEAEQNQVAAGGAGASPDTKTVATSPPKQQATSPPQNPSRPREGVVVTPPPTIPASSAISPTIAPKPKPNVENKVVEKPGEVTKSPDDEDDDDDDDSDEPAAATAQQQQQQQASPVQVSVRAASPIATVGQEFYVAIIVNGNTDIGYVNLAMTFDQNILEVKSVRDGGMIRNSSMPPHHAENGLLTVQMERPEGSSGSSSRGQLLLVVFKVKAAGQSPLIINEEQTFLRSVAGQVLPLRVQSAQVEAR